jgi:hypothetical protein
MLNGTIYNIARVHAHNFVETWTSLSGDAIHIRAVVSNGEWVSLGKDPFAPIVTLTFSDAGKKTGELQLLFNVPASQKNQTHETNIPGAVALWDTSNHIEASAANDLNARLTPGSWQISFQISGAGRSLCTQMLGRSVTVLLIEMSAVRRVTLMPARNSQNSIPGAFKAPRELTVEIGQP